MLKTMSIRSPITVLFSVAITVGLLFFLIVPKAHAETVTIYSQPDDSGEMLSQQPIFQNTWISAPIGNLFLGKGALTITFTMKDPNAGAQLPERVAIGTCLGCADLQTYYFTADDRALLSDGAFHTFTVTTGTTTLGIADGTIPIYITFYGLTQIQYGTHLKSNAAGTIPYLVIEGTPPPPTVIPQATEGSVTVYEQSDKSGTMTNPQQTFLNAFIDSASLGNLNLGQDKLYITFTMKDPNASSLYQQPGGGICIQPFGSTSCGSALQKYNFTDADRVLLADQAFHTFMVETGTTTSTYADGTRPVSIGFFNLSQYQFETKVKSNADATIPFLKIQKPPPSDPCAASGACASNVLFIPGIKGSVLKVNNDTVWPPSFWSDDLPELALTDDGESVNPVVVNGILEKFHGTPIYSGFAAFMNELVASGTTTEWKALPYDWRFSPERILADGIQTSTGTVDPIEEIEALAASSETGKVTIVAHSMGGLFGKAIIKKLQDEGKEGLIDSFVMIGTPQLGTPQAVASLLHGDGEGIWAGYIVNAAMARKIAQNFQSSYDLLPSSRYFDEIAEPVITFDPSAAFTQTWRAYWGPAINTYAEFFSFVTGGGVTRLDPEFTRLWIPEILRTDLVENARDFHEEYDTYAFPDSIRVVQVAGWGAPTVKAIKYKTRHFRQNYEPLFTIEGDNTVVYPSAVSSTVNETYFFNLEKYRKEKEKSTQHRNLLNAGPVQDVIRASISQEDISGTSYLVQTKPSPTDIADQLVVSTHSPVILGAYDQSGRFTGISPNQDLGADVLLITEDIPGSTFLSFGESQYLFLPKDGSYTVAFQGIGTGPTDVDIENFTNDTASLVATYSDISVAASTSATFVMNSASPQDVHIQIDSNGDGQVDTYVAPDNQPLTLNELLTNLKTVIQNLVIKDKLKTNLLKRIKNIEKKIAKQKNKNASKTVMSLEKQITKRGMKGKLSDADVAEIVRLLKQIESAL
ncbi:MAG: hypothetical protein Q8L30_02260 [bacterium]|nr:hypothetical protein [bacterium]